MTILARSTARVDEPPIDLRSDGGVIRHAEAGGARPLAEDRLWAVDDVAYFLDVPVQTVYSWRGQGRGPLGRLVGRRLRYRPEDVKAWVASLSTDVA